jgi:hypothetical protein
MNKHTVIAFLVGWFFAMFISPASIFGMAKGLTSAA